MTTNRENLLAKVRALLAKTSANGCTEAEALASLDKARAMIDAYEITDEELQLAKEEKAALHSDDGKDPHSIRRFLSPSVAAFCECKVWRNHQGGLTFCGLSADVQFAAWLLDHLTSFIHSELVEHLLGNMGDRRTRKRAINGFVLGCTNRIGDRLQALTTKSACARTGNGQALVVAKHQQIKQLMQEQGITLRSTHTRRRINEDSMNAGRAAGDRASFGRPVSGQGGARRLTSS